MTLVTLVAVLAVVQSLFGIGLLVFGTPTLLLMGYSFAQSLGVLLPASIAVSLLQLRASPRPDPAFVGAFVRWCLLPLGAALAAVLVLDLRASLNLTVAVLLLAFAGLRLSSFYRARAGAWVAAHESAWLMLMGVVHGLSNLGGGLLVILAASRHTDKVRIRSLVAFCYACFAALQLAVLAAVTPEVMGLSQLTYAAVGGAVFMLVGERVFRRVSASAFDNWLTALMAAYGCVLGLRTVAVL